jgi:hypothetical protein
MLTGGVCSITGTAATRAGVHFFLCSQGSTCEESSENGSVLWVHSFTLVSSLFAPRSFFGARLFGIDSPKCDATASLSPTTSHRCHHTCHSTLKPTIVLFVAALYRPTFSLPFTSPGLISLSDLTSAGVYSAHSPCWTRRTSTLSVPIPQSSRSSPTSARSNAEHPVVAV